MPSEIRQIVFTKDELRAALIDHCMRANIVLPDRGADEVKIGRNPDAVVILKYKGLNPADNKDVELGRDHVAAALIRYCRDHNIPLPRHAQKVLRPRDDGLALMVKVDLK